MGLRNGLLTHLTTPPPTLVGTFSLLTRHQHVTWNIPITAPLAAFHTVMAWGVGSSWTEHPFFSKYSAASPESSTEPLCPDPRISRFAPSSNMCSASSSETLCDVPYFAFDNFFLRFFTLPLKRITTSCSYSLPDMVMFPNSVPSMDGLIGWVPFLVNVSFLSPETINRLSATL